MAHKGLLLRGDASDLQRGESLLKGAIDEGESKDGNIHLRLISVCVWRTYQAKLCLTCLFCLWSAVENLQNLLFTRIGDPNGEKPTCGEDGTAANSGEAEENLAAGAATCKTSSTAIGGAKELSYS